MQCQGGALESDAKKRHTLCISASILDKVDVTAEVTACCIITYAIRPSTSRSVTTRLTVFKTASNFKEWPWKWCLLSRPCRTQSHCNSKCSFQEEKNGNIVKYVQKTSQCCLFFSSSAFLRCFFSPSLLSFECAAKPNNRL